jgi:hypothetical protein
MLTNLLKFSVLIMACLTVHTLNKKKINKETKTKEFTHLFSAMKANYAELLNAMLAKHHIRGKLKQQNVSVTIVRSMCCLISRINS